MTILGEAQVRVGADMSTFKREVTSGINQTAQKLSSTGAKLTELGGTLTRSLTLPIVAIGTAAFKSAIDFEASMAQITALVGIPREQVKAWEGDVRNLAVTYGKTATEASEALYFITSAGIDAAMAMEVLDTSLKASAAGLGDVQTIADALTSVVNAYASTNMTAAQAADTLTAAVKYGKLEATELAPVLGRLLPTSSALGISFEDVAGTLAVMSRTGLDAAEASTSLSAIMSTLLKPTAQSAKLLEANGLSMASLRDQASGPGGLISVMRTLDSTFGDNDEALAQIVPNIRAFRGVMNVLAQDGATVDEVMRGVAGATGSLDDAFGEIEKTAKFQLAQTMSIVKDLFLEIGQTVMPIIVSALERLRAKLAAASEWWGGLSEEGRKFILYAAGAAAALGPLLMAFGSMAKMLGGLLTVGPQLAKLFSPWGIAIAAIAGIIALVVSGADVGKITDNIVEGIKGFVEKLPEFIDKAIEGIMSLVDGIIEALPDLIDAGVEILLAIVDGILEALPDLIDAAVELVVKLLDALVKMLPRLIDAGIKLVMGLIDGITKALPKIIDAIVKAIPVLLDAIIGALPLIIDAAFQLFMGLIDGLIEAIPPLLTAILEAIPVITVALISALPKIIQAAITLFIGIADGLIRALPQISLAIVTELIPGILIAVASGLDAMWDAGWEMVMKFWEGLKTAMKDVWDWVVQQANNIALALNPTQWGKAGASTGTPAESLANLASEEARKAAGKTPAEWWGMQLNAQEIAGEASGKALVRSYAAGITSASGSATKAMAATNSMLAAYMPHSPAKMGPLSGAGSPYLSGRAIVNMLAEGILDASPASSSAMARALPTIGGTSTGTPSSGDMNVNVVMNFSGDISPSGARAAGGAAGDEILRRLAVARRAV